MVNWGEHKKSLKKPTTQKSSRIKSSSWVDWTGNSEGCTLMHSKLEATQEETGNLKVQVTANDTQTMYLHIDPFQIWEMDLFFRKKKSTQWAVIDTRIEFSFIRGLKKTTRWRWQESTPLKTSMEPEDHSFEKETHLQHHHFWVPS